MGRPAQQGFPLSPGIQHPRDHQFALAHPVEDALRRHRPVALLSARDGVTESAEFLFRQPLRRPIDGCRLYWGAPASSPRSAKACRRQRSLTPWRAGRRPTGRLLVGHGATDQDPQPVRGLLDVSHVQGDQLRAPRPRIRFSPRSGQSLVDRFPAHRDAVQQLPRPGSLPAQASWVHTPSHRVGWH
jgi:hypothetical protein